MTTIETINDKLDFWAEALFNRVTEPGFIEKKDVKTAITVHFKEALTDLLKIQIPEVERKLNQAKMMLFAPGGSKESFKSTITELKQKRKELYELYSKLDRDNMNREMCLWMRKYHNDSLNDFHKWYNENNPKPNTKTT